MKKQKYLDNYLLNFFMQCNSLKHLLEILETICIVQDLKYLNKRTKSFEYFRFTFFGLMEKVKNILGYILFKAESLKEKYLKIQEIYPKLLQLKQEVFEIDELIKNKEMKKVRENIIKISQEYSKIFEEINEMIEEYA
jgi:vacuolar-type H+-ATPase catalytic subunit A/Vma1